MEVDEVIQSFGSQVEGNSLMLSEPAHDANESDFASLGILNANEIDLFHPAPGFQLLNLNREIKQFPGLRLGRAKQDFFRGYFFGFDFAR